MSRPVFFRGSHFVALDYELGNWISKVNTVNDWRVRDEK